MRYLTMSAIVFFIWCAAAACTPVAPRGPVNAADAEATLRVAQSTVTAQAQAQATEDARHATQQQATQAAVATRDFRTASAFETRIQRTADFESTRDFKTAQAQDTRIAQTVTAEATRDFRTQSAADKNAEGTATQTLINAKRAADWDAFWMALLINGGAIVVLVGVSILAAWGAVFVYTRLQRGLVIETGAGTLLLGLKPKVFERPQLPPAGNGNAVPLLEYNSDAPNADDIIPVNTSRGLKILHYSHNHKDRKKVLQLLADATRYAQATPGWSFRQLPGHRLLGWSSADKWYKARRALGDALEKDGDDVVVAVRFNGLADLFDAVVRHRHHLR